jgi:hypothetical protein
MILTDKNHLDKSGEHGRHKPLQTVRSAVKNIESSIESIVLTDLRNLYLYITTRAQNSIDSQEPHF